MLVVYTLAKYLDEWLNDEMEIPHYFGKDQIKFCDVSGSPAGFTTTTGMLLGKITASGKYVELNPAATDGSQNAAAFLINDTSHDKLADDIRNSASNEGVAIESALIVRTAALVRNDLPRPPGPQIATAVGQVQSAGVVTAACF